MSDPKYKPEFVHEIIRLGQEGKSVTQMAAHFGVSMVTLNKWGKDLNKPEFIAAKELAVTMAESYWEDIGQKGTKGLLQKFVPASWIYMMKCRYRENWKEDTNQRVELYSEVKGMSDQQIEDTLKAIIAKKAMGNPAGSTGAPVQPEAI